MSQYLINIEEMMEVGAHFGHQTRRWNPKMKPYIFGAHSGVHILDLQQTQSLCAKALNAVESIVAQGSSVLFVGTKTQAQEVIAEQAKRAQMPYVNQRWLGGMLTNFQTIRKSVERLIEFTERREKNDFQGYKKKELLEIDREILRLESSFGGIKHMKRLPGAIFLVDPNIEKIAIHEANVLNIPLIALTDSNCDPDPIDYVIPSNDDAQRCIQLFTSKLADACLAGLAKREEIARSDSAKPEASRRPTRKAQVVEGAGTAYVSKADAADEATTDGSFSAVVEAAVEAKE